MVKIEKVRGKALNWLCAIGLAGIGKWMIRTIGLGGEGGVVIEIGPFGDRD